MKTYTFVPKGNVDEDEIVLHAYNYEAAHAKLEDFVGKENMSLWERKKFIPGKIPELN